MKFDFEKNKIKILIALLIFLILLLIFMIFRTIERRGRPTVGFYKIPEDTVQNFEKIINDLKDEKGKLQFKTNFLVLDSGLSLNDQKKQLKKLDILIAIDDLNVAGLNVKHPYDGSLLREMTSSIHSIKGVSKGKNIVKLPLLVDHLELTIDRTVMNETNVEIIGSWKHIENFCEKSKEIMSMPMVFAGKDEAFVMDLIGAFCEAVSGKENYEKAVKIIIEETKKAKKNASINYIKLAEELAGKKGAPLYDGIAYMNKLYHAGYFTNTVFSLGENEVRSYMAADMAAIVPQYLSNHRRVSLDALKRYDSTYVVSHIPASRRSFVAPVICAVPLSKNKNARILGPLLVSRPLQEQLSRNTGLAPVLANCYTPDKEADDVRYWVAATNSPLNGLSNDAFTNKTQVRELEKMLVNYILK